VRCRPWFEAQFEENYCPVFLFVARVASIHGELLASVVVVDRGCAVPGLLEINGRATGKVCRSREREGNLVRASEQ
jgi:hypothetical protein